ncbi:MAG: hypothetical protein ACTHMF_14705 [Leifsonia sp.]|uniref:hypothetical protein n=1 Tax=Leifsonia sp. TaxID=1870902 RepID=UPI003F7F5A4C
MENAATTLATLLDKWKVVGNGETVYVRREAGAQRDYQFWRDQVAAAGLVHQVGNELDALRAMGRNIDHYARAFPTWAAAVFAPEEQWNQNTGNRVVIDQGSVDLLFSLGDYLSATTPAVAISAERRSSMRTALDEVLELLSDGPISLGDAEKRYLFELVDAVRSATDEASTLGSFDLLRRIHELVGYLNTLADQLQDAGVDESFVVKVRDVARRVVPYTRMAAGAALAVLGAAADISQIASHP